MSSEATPPAPDVREGQYEPRAEWDEAVFCAREDWTRDPHQHIERLIQAGDALLTALRAPAEAAPDYGPAESEDYYPDGDPEEDTTP